MLTQAGFLLTRTLLQQQQQQQQQQEEEEEEERVMVGHAESEREVRGESEETGGGIIGMEESIKGF